MKKLCLKILLVCFLLSGCGSHTAQERYRTFSEDLKARETLDFTADLRAQYPDKTVELHLGYALSDGEQTVTVLEPKSIAGIRAKIAEGKTALEYEDLRLDVGDLDHYGLCPMSALPLLVEALKNGHPEAFGEEASCHTVQLVLDDHLTALVHFSPEDMIPVYAELLSGDRAVVACEIINWT